MENDIPSDRLSRRGFLKVSAIWAGGAWIVGVPAVTANPYRVLTEKEAEIMDALADAIIPPGRYSGGKDAWVTRFIDQQLSRYGYLQHDKEMYRTCLPAINEDSIAQFGEPFIALDEEKQEEYLKAIEAGSYNAESSARGWAHFTPSAFFNTMVNQCMMGFYGSSFHGGNRDYVSYRMLSLLAG